MLACRVHNDPSWCCQPLSRLPPDSPRRVRPRRRGAGSATRLRRISGPPHRDGGPAEHRVRRPLHLRSRELRHGARRLLVPGTALVGARLSGRRAQPDEDNERAHLSPRARRGRERADARRPAALPIPDRVHHRSELVDDDLAARHEPAGVHEEGRIRDRGRLQGRGRLREPWLGALRSEHAARAARRPVRRDEGVTSSLSLVLRDRNASTIFHRRTTPARRAFSASSRTTTPRSGSR